MAKFPVLPSQFIVLSLLSILSATSVAGESHDEFVRTMDKELHGIKKEKLSHFRVYWHDIVTGAKPSAVQIVPPPANYSRTAFGMVRMIDNPLTLGPELSSKLVGKAQGFYGQASQGDIALLMAMNFAFTEGKYNGSTITVLGRNPVFSPVREMSVIGGSGLFRLARGYAQLRTHTFDQSTGDATVEYNIYVLHY